jgi:hypothetical protein
MRKAFLLAGALLAASAGWADDGIWLFNQAPKDLISKKYHFEVTDEFLDHLRLSSVRFNNGGSGSFISPQGLLFTNHHVGADCIQQLSSKERDYYGEGFHARTGSEEKPCPDLEVNVLLKVEDVTAKVTAGVKESTPPAEANRMRNAAMSAIEKSCAAQTGNRCDVVTLYAGGQYDLYQYRKYTDVRLVFAPEADIAAFGGDPDNYTYPRYCLDFALFRAYQNGQPAKVKDYLQWSKEGVKDGELTFVSGHPGSTGRLATYAELEFSRDISCPLVHARLKTLIDTLLAYSAKSAENARAARENLQRQQNSYKAYTGFLRGLRDAGLMAEKNQEEARLRAAVRKDPKMAAQYGALWDEVAASYQEYAAFYQQYWLFERAGTRGSDLMEIGRNIIRYAEEKTKPNDQRLRDYRETALPSLEQSMFSTAPIEDSMEIAVIADYLRFLEQQFGASDPTVKALVGGKTPQAAAEDYVGGSKLKDVAERKRLAAGLDAVKSSADGIIRLMRILDEPARKYRKLFEDKVESIQRSSASKIAQVRFQIMGTSAYPDATFTLRLSYGPVRGYNNAAGKWVPYTTRLDGLYRRATGNDPFKLPASWVKVKPKLDLQTPFNFVTTADTHGGNSGSPTVNTKGEVIGILFDGNLEGLPNRFVYREKSERSVHVANNAIVEALRKVYSADAILKELGY